jgi:hypothetical protein
MAGFDPACAARARRPWVAPRFVGRLRARSGKITIKRSQHCRILREGFGPVEIWLCGSVGLSKGSSPAIAGAQSRFPII